MYTSLQHDHIVVPLTRLNALVQKRLHLKEQIKEAKKRPSYSDLYIRDLKKENLLLKDEIEVMRADRQKQKRSKRRAA